MARKEAAAEATEAAEMKNLEKPKSAQIPIPVRVPTALRSRI
jgi:hypothetical protein